MKSKKKKFINKKNTIIDHFKNSIFQKITKDKFNILKF